MENAGPASRCACLWCMHTTSREERIKKNEKSVNLRTPMMIGKQPTRQAPQKTHEDEPRRAKTQTGPHRRDQKADF